MIRSRIPGDPRLLRQLGRLALTLASIFLGIHLSALPAAWAQETSNAQEADQTLLVAALRQEVHSLQGELRSVLAAYEARLGQLETRMAELQGQIPSGTAAFRVPPAVEEELERIRDRHAGDKLELTRDIERTRSSVAPLTFMPEITMFGNFLGRVDSRPVISPEGDRIDDRFVLRAGEFELRGAVDPYADAFLAIPLEAESPNGPLEADIEEGYVVLKGLPHVPEMPLGLKFKIGKYRPEIGKNNLIHFHDLMWSTRPLAVATFLGTEGLGASAEAGFQTIGINAEIFLPSPSENATIRTQFGFGTTGNLAVTQGNEGNNPIFYTHTGWYQRLNSSQAFELGVSYLTGKNDLDGDLNSKIVGVDLTYTWKPGRQGLWRSFIAGGEFFYASLDRGREPRQTPLGFYLFSQYQLSRSLYLGARYDYAQRLADEKHSDRAWSAWLTYYTSEFLRFRSGFERRDGDVPNTDGTNTFMFELNFVFGVHPTEPYWINR